MVNGMLVLELGISFKTNNCLLHFIIVKLKNHVNWYK